MENLMTLVPTLTALLLTAPAHAGKCDYLLRRADTYTEANLAKAFQDAVRCDKDFAEQNYTRFMASATDADTLVSLTMTALDANIWNPVWGQLSKIQSYDARDEIAARVGEACMENERVVSFLQGAYFGLRDIEFQQWDDAFVSCEAPALLDWLTTQIENPPDRLFDEKYNALMSIYVTKQGRGALKSLAKSAVRSAEAGPYDAVLMQMDAAVAPQLGEDLSPEDRAALEAALIAVAKRVGADKSRAVADRLATAGAQEAAASLLPSIYADRMQSSGGFLYGAAAIERAECKGVKTAVIHHAEVNEAGKRWLILEEVEAPLRSAKARLSKCTPEDGDWPVATTPEPVRNGKEINAWLDGLEEQWSNKEYAVKMQGEKDVILD
jgi:hypothetical protein